MWTLAPPVWRAWLRCPWAAAGPGRASRRHTEPHISNQVPLVWRAPEGPEGTGGLRGAAPNAVRTPSLAGGRALRRPEHPWGTQSSPTQQGMQSSQAQQAAGPDSARNTSGARRSLVARG